MAAVARRIFAALVVLVSSSSALAARAADLAGSVIVEVRSSDGTPIAGARVSLHRTGSTRDFAADGAGSLLIASVDPGTYVVSATAPGYAPLDGRPLAVRVGDATRVALTLARSASSLTTIGSVTTAGSAPVSTSTAATQTLRTQDYAARGYTRVSDVLTDALSATIIPAGSGSVAAPRSVALRGPDPTETLVDVDGHEINSGVTGDFDLSLLDPADFESVQLVYGIAPSALVGPSTIGGAINVRTLEPTATSHGLLRLTGGSFGAIAQTVQATGTADRFGYALSLHRTFAGNDVSHASVPTGDGESAVVGSDVASATSLAKVRYAFGPARAGYADVTVRDQSVVRDLSAALTSLVGPDTYAVSAGSRLLGHNAGYGLDVQVPLQIDRSSGEARTTVLVRHLTSFSGQSVEGAASGSNTAYFDDRDRIDDDTLELDRRFERGSVTLKYRQRGERLDTFDPTRAGSVTEQSVRVRPLAVRADDPVAVAPGTDATSTTVSGLAQTQRSLALRATYDPSTQWHATLAAYESSFSTFGRSFDPRVGVAYAPDARLALHASVGSTFQAPQLTALYVPATLPAPDANGHISIGNPNLKADHATEYDLGVETLVGPSARATRASLDLYRTNLRTPAQRLLAAATCEPDAPSLACASYPINVGSATYTGAELRLERSLGTATFARLGYAIASTYAVDAPAAVQNGSIVPYEQFLGVPLHKATLEIERRAPAGLTFDTALVYEGRYNEVNRGPFATLRASVGYAAHGYEIVVAGQNLTNVYATRFTQAGAGVTYGGTDGPIATDAYALPSRSVSVSLARRF